jgi:putative endonuclease
VQRVAKRSGAPLIRGLRKLGMLLFRDCDDPGSAAHHFASFRAALRPGNAARALLMSKRYLVYILANRPKGVLYVGVTNDLARRVWEHRSKVAKGFTSAYGVIRLVYCEEHASILEARAREHTLKRWRRAWKFKLIEDVNPTWRDLYDELILL